MTNLIIAAHPDDEILGCGGIINKYGQEQDFFVLIMTNGADSRYDDSMANILRDNAIKANKYIGTKEVFFESFSDQKLDTYPLVDIIKTVEKYIKELKPQKVFTQHIGDLNKDHETLAKAVFTATRPVVGQIVREVYSYCVPSSTEWNFIQGENVFIPNIYVDIAKQLENKIEAMKFYESECRPYPHPRSPEAIRTYSKYMGINVGLGCAESFKLIRKIGEL
jgi:LmbE family N-acetylglucosaminyl deacetylase